MEGNSLVSVIIPVYNGEKYLKRCADAILSQKYQLVELILSDDGSSDRSGEICDEYASQYQQVKVIHSENGGVSKARNRALQVANGEYVIFVDVDDVLANDEVISNCMELAKECRPDAFYWECKEFTDGEDLPSSKKIQADQARWITDKEEIENYVTKITIWKFMFSREILKGQSFDESISLGEDTLFLTQVLLNANTLIDTNGVGYLRCLRAGSLVHSEYQDGVAEKIYELHGVLKHILGDEKGRKQIYESIVISHFTSLIQKIRKYPEKRLIKDLRKRIWSVFPSFLGNHLLHASTKLLILCFAMSPGFYNFVYDVILKRGERY